jgi:hypothetical protein
MALEMARMTIRIDLKRPSLSAFRLGGFSCFRSDPLLYWCADSFRSAWNVRLLASPIIKRLKEFSGGAQGMMNQSVP